MRCREAACSTLAALRSKRSKMKSSGIVLLRREGRHSFSTGQYPPPCALPGRGRAVGAAPIASAEGVPAASATCIRGRTDPDRRQRTCVVRRTGRADFHSSLPPVAQCSELRQELQGVRGFDGAPIQRHSPAAAVDHVIARRAPRTGTRFSSLGRRPRRHCFDKLLTELAAIGGHARMEPDGLPGLDHGCRRRMARYLSRNFRKA